jgi:hypothetical protein
MAPAMSRSQHSRIQACLAACTHSTSSKSSDDKLRTGLPPRVVITDRSKNSPQLKSTA